jgi:DNA polymerase-3 subunit alpha
VDDFVKAVSGFPDTVAKVYARPGGRFDVAANLGPAGYARETGPGYGEAFDGNLALICDAPPRRSGAFQWAQRLGIVGRKATEKRVPAEVFVLRDSNLELFLGRLWAGDGFFCGPGDNVPFYATSSAELARDVQTLLLRLGIVSGVHAKRFKYRGGQRPGYTVHLLGEGSVETFVERVAPHAVGRERQVQLLRQRLANTERGRTSKDTIPVEVREWVRAEQRRSGLNWLEIERRSGVSVRELYGRGSGLKRGFRRSTLARLAGFFGSVRLAQISRSDVFWDRIVSIEPRGIQDTYDLTVERDHNFVADGVIVHNSHSAAYALLAYQCAYLKAHHAAEFMAATLTSEMTDSARIVTLIEECRRLGLEILPPDVNRSEWRFTIEGAAIRFGLGAVRNVGQAVVEGLVAARAAGGAFADLFDLACRLDARGMNKRVLESLVASGACDALGGERGALFAGAGTMLERAASRRRERESGQSSLFADAGEGAIVVAAAPLPSVPPWTGRERSTHEKEVLGFYFSEHPLEHLRERVEALATHRIADALQLDDGAEVRVAGLVGEIKSIMTRTGRPMAIVTLEDLTGRVECTVFPDTFESVRPLLTAESVVVASGRVEVREDRGTKLLLSEVRGLEDARQAYRRCLHIEVRAEELSEDRLGGIDEVLSSHPGEAEVYLHIVRPDHSRMAMRSRRFTVAEDDRVIAHLKERHPSLRVRWGKGAS